MLRIEIYKALKTKEFIFTFILTLVIFVAQAFWVKEYIVTGFILDNGKYAHITPDMSFMQAWIGQDVFSAYAYMFYSVLFPLLAALPYASNHFREHQIGYDKQIVCRVGKMKYNSTKLMTSFIVGGMVITIPSLLSLLWSMSWLPLIPLNLGLMQTGVTSESLWAELFVQYPLLYALLYILLDFAIGGVLACSALALTYVVKSRFQLLSLPMMINLLLVEILNYVPGAIGRLCRLIPYCYISPFSLVPVTGVEICISLSIIILIVYIIYLIKGKRGDVL